MVTPQSVQGHTGLTHHFLIFDIRALWRSGLSAREPECHKLKNGGLGQYSPERFGRLILLQSEKYGTERVKTRFNVCYSFDQRFYIYLSKIFSKSTKHRKSDRVCALALSLTSQ